MDDGAELNADELEDRLSALESARSWGPRVVSRLESRIRGADHLQLFRINPKAYAAETSMADAEAIDLFLYATHVGLFQMEWNVVCASCGNTARSFRGLAKVDPHFVCEVCQMDNHASLDEYIQVVFTIAPAVRTIPYHDPDLLSAYDRYFNYQVSRDIKPGSGGLTTLQALEATTHSVGYVAAGDSAEVEFEFSGQVFAIRDLLHAASAMYFPDDAVERQAEPLDLRLTLQDGRLTDQDRSLQPLEYSHAQGPEMRLLFPGVTRIPHGSLRIVVENRMTERASVWVVEYPRIPQVFEPLEFQPVLSAKQALSTQTFRTLFRSETVAASESLEVRDLTFLFTDLKDSTAMYDRIGDASAYNLVRLHFDALEVAIRENEGAIVKTIGDAIMATFPEPAAGVRAALAMPQRLEDFNRSSSAHLVLKMGLHRGHAIAVSSNEAVDYFGQTVNIAARIQAMADAGQVCLSDAVFESPGVAQLLEGWSVEHEAGVMKGVDEEIPVYRLSLAT